LKKEFPQLITAYLHKIKAANKELTKKGILKICCITCIMAKRKLKALLMLLVPAAKKQYSTFPLYKAFPHFVMHF
jgi:hypothetical protein